MSNKGLDYRHQIIDILHHNQGGTQTDRLNDWLTDWHTNILITCSSNWLSLTGKAAATAAKLSFAKSLCRTICQRLDSGSFNSVYLPTVLSHLKQAELISRLDQHTSTTKYEKKRIIAPGQKHEKQPKQFYRVLSKPGHKRKAEILRYHLYTWTNWNICLICIAYIRAPNPHEAKRLCETTLERLWYVSFI